MKDRLEMLRRERGIRQEYLADALEVSRQRAIVENDE